MRYETDWNPLQAENAKIMQEWLDMRHALEIIAKISRLDTDPNSTLDICVGVAKNALLRKT